MANNINTSIVYKTKLTANDSSAQELLGALRYEYDSTNGLRIFKYVQAASDTTVANGTVVYTLPSATDTTQLIASNDISDTAANNVMGVGIGAITASYYGWIQVYGYHSAIKTNGDDDIAAGDTLIADVTTDGTCNSVAAGTASTYKPLGYALAADSDANNTVAGRIECFK